MIKIDYLMRDELVTQYAETKDAIISARNQMTAGEVMSSKAEILDSCQINDLDSETGLADYKVENKIAYIPVQGMLVQQVDVCAAFFEENITTYGFIRGAAIDADNRRDVDKIVFVIDSGGGVVSGIDETAEVIRSLKKPTMSIVKEMAASAAYWIASQSDEIVGVSKTGFYGSIGVVTELIDRKGQDKAEGIARFVVTNSDSKDKRPNITTDEGMQVVVDRLNSIYNVFVDSVMFKRGDKLSRERIVDLSGKVLIAEKALEYGLLDKLMSPLELNDYLENKTVNSTVVNGVVNIMEVSMNHNEFINSNPEAKKEFEACIELAKNEGMEEGAKVGREKEAARVAEILDLANVSISDEAKAAIKDGVDPGDYAKAALKSGKAQIQQGDNSEKIKGVNSAKELKDDLPDDGNNNVSAVASSIVAKMTKNKRR